MEWWRLDLSNTEPENILKLLGSLNFSFFIWKMDSTLRSSEVLWVYQLLLPLELHFLECHDTDQATLTPLPKVCICPVLKRYMTSEDEVRVSLGLSTHAREAPCLESERLEHKTFTGSHQQLKCHTEWHTGGILQCHCSLHVVFTWCAGETLCLSLLPLPYKLHGDNGMSCLQRHCENLGPTAEDIAYCLVS